jgi:hypothetical protein
LYFFTEKWGRGGGSVFVALIKSATRDTIFVKCMLNYKSTEKIKLPEILGFVKINQFELAVAGPGKYNVRRDGVLGPQLLSPLHRHWHRPDQEKV